MPLLCRSPHLLVATAALTWVSPAHAQSPPASLDTVVATPLRTLDTVKFGDHAFMAWMDPPQCDPDGNVFLIQVPAATNPALYEPPSQVVAISPEGEMKALFSPRSIPDFAQADEITVSGLEIDPEGETLFLLVWVRQGDEGQESIVSFDKKGRYRSRVEIDGEEIVVGRVDVFASGDFLLIGRHIHWNGSRVAVMPSGGGSLRDVIGLTIDEGHDPDGDVMRPDHTVSAEDGRIYFVADEDRLVYAINPSGDAELAFALLPLPGGPRLIGFLGAAGSRVALKYFEKTAADRGQSWIAVYDVALGERVAVYGPIPGVPLCYSHERSRDHFTLLKDGNTLVSAAP